MSFTAPLFLIALLAGAIPVVLHMINRQKAPVMQFSTLRFLRLSVERTRKRKRINDLLLLLLRMAAMMLVAVALAQPTMRHMSGLLGRQAERAIVLILDNSASMATIDETGPRWELATAVAEQLLYELTTRDSVALLVACGPKQPESNRLYRNHEAVHQALGASRVFHEQADLAARVKAARELLQNADAPNKEIYVVTDMQETAWNSMDQGRADGEQEVEENDDIPLVVVDVHGPILPNTALIRVELNAAAPVAGVPVQATITVQGDAGIAVQKNVELYVDGRKISVSPTLAIGAGEIAVHTFQFSPSEHSVRSSHVQRGEFRLLGDDACRLDDRRFFAMIVNPNIPVAIVQSGEQAIPYLADAYYLERALLPIRHGDWAIRPVMLAPERLATESLSQYTAIFCVNLPALDPVAAQRLRDYALQGGHVVWTCGDRVDPVQYKAMNEQAGGQLLPARLTEVMLPDADRTDPPRIGWLDIEHSALAPLVEPASLYQSVLVYTRIGMALDEGSDCRVLAKLDNGDPLLVERAVGRGSVLLLATSVDRNWTNLPLRPLFLPLMSRLTFHLANTHDGQTQRIAGTPLTAPIQNQETSSVEIVRPSGETIRLDASDIAGDEQAIRYNDTHDVGVYEMHVTDANQTRQSAFAFNLDPGELKPEILTREQLESRLGPRQLIFCDDPAVLASTMDRLREGESLKELFLVAVLLALVAEAFVANRRVTTESAGETAGTPARQRTDDWIKRFRLSR